MSAQISIVIAKMSGLTVPSSAVHTSAASNWVLVLHGATTPPRWAPGGQATRQTDRRGSERRRADRRPLRPAQLASRSCWPTTARRCHRRRAPRRAKPARAARFASCSAAERAGAAMTSDPPLAASPSRLAAPSRRSQDGAPLLDLAGVSKTYLTGEVTIHALAGVDLSISTRRVRRDHGPVGIGQVDADAHPRLPRHPHRRERT